MAPSRNERTSRMKPSFILMMLIAAVLGVESPHAYAAQPTTLRVPATLSVDTTSPPFWVSADAATGADGSVDYEVFGRGLREGVRAQAIDSLQGAESTMAPCPQFTIGNPEEPFDTPSDRH